MKIAYVRVSTVEQNEARQIEGLEKHGIDKWYIEKISGKNMDRPELQRMLKEAQEGDTIYIHDFSRLARSTKDLLDIVERLNNRGVHLISNKENLDTKTPTGKLMLTMIAAINTFERENMLERQREGIAIAKANGVYKGRNRATIDEDIFRSGLKSYENGDITKAKFAEICGVTQPTLNRIIREMVA